MSALSRLLTLDVTSTVVALVTVSFYYFSLVTTHTAATGSRSRHIFAIFDECGLSSNADVESPEIMSESGSTAEVHLVSRDVEAGRMRPIVVRISTPRFADGIDDVIEYGVAEPLLRIALPDSLLSIDDVGLKGIEVLIDTYDDDDDSEDDYTQPVDVYYVTCSTFQHLVETDCRQYIRLSAFPANKSDVIEDSFEYFVTSMTSFTTTVYRIGIVAAFDDTAVKIQFPTSTNTLKVTFKGVDYGNGDVLDVILTSYETLVVSAVDGHLSGTIIGANYPIYVSTTTKNERPAAASAGADAQHNSVKQPVRLGGVDLLQKLLMLPSPTIPAHFSDVSSESVTMSSKFDVTSENSPAKRDQEDIGTVTSLSLSSLSPSSANAERQSSRSVARLDPLGRRGSAYVLVAEYEDSEVTFRIVAVSFNTSTTVRLTRSTISHDVLLSPQRHVDVHVTGNDVVVAHSNSSVMVFVLMKQRYSDAGDSNRKSEHCAIEPITPILTEVPVQISRYPQWRPSSDEIDSYIGTFLLFVNVDLLEYDRLLLNGRHWLLASKTSKNNSIVVPLTTVSLDKPSSSFAVFRLYLTEDRYTLVNPNNDTSSEFCFRFRILGPIKFLQGNSHTDSPCFSTVRNSDDLSDVIDCREHISNSSRDDDYPVASSICPDDAACGRSNKVLESLVATSTFDDVTKNVSVDGVHLAETDGNHISEFLQRALSLIKSSNYVSSHTPSNATGATRNKRGFSSKQLTAEPSSGASTSVPTTRRQRPRSTTLPSISPSGRNRPMKTSKTKTTLASTRLDFRPAPSTALPANVPYSIGPNSNRAAKFVQDVVVVQLENGTKHHRQSQFSSNSADAAMFVIDDDDDDSRSTWHVSPTVLAVLGSLASAGFFVVACIAGFVVADFACGPGSGTNGGRAATAGGNPRTHLLASARRRISSKVSPYFVD